MGPQESMTRGECGRGGVEAVGPCDDQSYVVVESFGAAVVHSEADGGEDAMPLS